MGPSPDELGELEQRVQHAMATGDTTALRILGYGEISVVLGWPPDHATHACKRLPPFPDEAALAAYASLLDWYLARLAARGVAVWPTSLATVRPRSGGVVAYLVQPAVPPAAIGPDVLRESSPSSRHPLLDEIVRVATATVGPQLGLDAQLSNWAWIDGVAWYFDVSTPLARDASGRTLLDADLLLASFPWVARPLLRRYVVPDVVARYHDRRSVLLDLAANLVKERLDAWIPAAVSAANAVVDVPLTPDEVRADYRSDARLWGLVQRARLADRWWQRRVRRRPYPFLLPGRISR